MSLFCKLLVVVLLLGGVSGTLNKTATKHLGDRYRHLVNKLFSPPHWNIQSTQAFEIITSHSAQPVAESVTESFRILCSDSLEKGLTLGMDVLFYY